jgi:murein DD-endopeptidase MepM/ murein hydrolase activator NlpD
MLLNLGVNGSLIAKAGADSKFDQIRWASYTDPRYDFTLQYPADWTVQPRSDNPDAIGEVLTLVGPVSDKESAPYSIAIGQYLYEIKPGEILSNWTTQYPSVFHSTEIKTTGKHDLTLGESEATYVRGSSPLTEYQYTNIRRGTTVWFIWANFGSSANGLYNDIYNHMVESLKFGSKSPTTLQGIYGNSFQPHDFQSITAYKSSGGHLAVPAFRPTSLSSSWQSPVLKDSAGNSRTVNCGSTFHTNGASYAADISVPRYTPVYAANLGVIEFWGWDTSGYGNLIKINYTSNGKRHLYAHLNEINFAQSSTIDKGAYLGRSGNTGTFAYHLHFHVQDGPYQYNSNGVTLVGMVGFTSNSNYPGTSGPCGLMGR